MGSFRLSLCVHCIRISWLINNRETTWLHIRSAIDFFLYGLHLHFQIPVLELKQEISYYCGVSPERQHRLIFRGSVLKDDQSLSDYHIEEGHTLYLVEGPPPIPRFSSNAAADSNLGPGTVTNHSYQLTARQDDTPSVVFPDSITTLSRHLHRLRHLFAAYGNNDNNPQTSGRSREDLIARASHWAELVHTMRRLLIGEVAECLSNISMLLVDQVNVTEPSARRSRQARAVETGCLLWNLGRSLVALGNATSRISNGETQEGGCWSCIVHIPHRAKSVRVTSILAANKYWRRKERKSYFV